MEKEKTENLQILFARTEDMRHALVQELEQFIDKAFAVRDKYSIDINESDEACDYWWNNCNAVVITTRHENVNINIYAVHKALGEGFVVSGRVCDSERDDSDYEEYYAAGHLPNLLSIASFINGVIERESNK